VVGQVEENWERWLEIETTAGRVGCWGCGTRAVTHGRHRVQVRDLSTAGRPVRLVWAKRILRCVEPACEIQTWSQESDEIAPRAVLTERVRKVICRRVGPGETSVAAVAWAFGGGPGTPP
jgi:hypothetical protein